MELPFERRCRLSAAKRSAAFDTSQFVDDPLPSFENQDYRS
jgi:hypothetical protein